MRWKSVNPSVTVSQARLRQLPLKSGAYIWYFTAAMPIITLEKQARQGARGRREGVYRDVND